MSLECYPSVVEVQPKDGDQLFGQATIQCPVCSKVRVYWVYMIYGSFGVYAEGKDRDYPFLSFSKENGATVVSTFLKRKDLQPMPTRVEWRGSQACIPSHPGEVHLLRGPASELEDDAVWVGGRLGDDLRATAGTRGLGCRIQEQVHRPIAPHR